METPQEYARLLTARLLGEPLTDAENRKLDDWLAASEANAATFRRLDEDCPADRLLTSRLGAAAAQLIEQKKYGYMVALQGDQIVPVPLSEVAGKLKLVTPDHDLVIQGKRMGISFGV